MLGEILIKTSCAVNSCVSPEEEAMEEMRVARVCGPGDELTPSVWYLVGDYGESVDSLREDMGTEISLEDTKAYL